MTMTKKSLLAMTLMLSAVVSLHAQDLSIPMTWAVQNHDVRSQAMGGTTSLSNQFGLSVSGGYNWGGNSPLPTYGSIGLGVGIVKIIELEACYMFNRNNSLNMIGAQLSVKF